MAKPKSPVEAKPEEAIFTLGKKQYKFTMPTFEHKRKVYDTAILAFEINQEEEAAVIVAQELIELGFGGMIAL